MGSREPEDGRIALIIGNSAYIAVSPLTNPKNDADLMAKTLQSVRFEVNQGRRRRPAHNETGYAP
jgi:uncharacterized caspase-like protein